MRKKLYIKGYVIQQGKTGKGYIRLCNMTRMDVRRLCCSKDANRYTRSQ